MRKAKRNRHQLDDYENDIKRISTQDLPLKIYLNQSRQGGTNVPPDFQNSSKKIISHRFRVIKV